MPMNRAIAITFMLFLLTVSKDANALWELQVVNDSQIPISITRPVMPGRSVLTLNVLGSIGVAIPGRGVIQFTDIGHQNNNCSRPYWGVRIQYGDKVWGYFYDGGGVLHVTLNAQGEPTFAAVSEPSQVVVGGGHPTCRS